MADGVDAMQRASYRDLVGDVGDHQLGAGIKVVGELGVDVRTERVEHAHLVALAEERIDDVRPDEAGTAGDEDSHGRAL
jgi:hypothetical protein